MGSQEPGGLIEATHEDVAKVLGYSRPHISRVFHVLEHHGALRKVRRGQYQLNPAASLRGGLRQPGGGKRGGSGRAERVEQLDLLRAILNDADAPKAFRDMARPGSGWRAARKPPRTMRRPRDDVRCREWTARRQVLWGSFNGLAYVPQLPPTGYALLLYLLTQQETGGLVATRLVTVVRRGRFQLHPTLAAYDTPKDQQQAIAALPRSQRLDVGNFEDEYERRLELHQQAKARKAEQRSKVTSLSRARLKPVR